MSTEVVRSNTPEEEELARKREELAQLEAELADRELDLATLRTELHRFEQTYLRVVGVRYAELDELLAQIAELQAKQAPEDEDAQHQAAEARARADDTARASEDAAETAVTERFEPSPSLKSLYRELAKKVHPDLADNEDDRSLRTRLMAAVNRAYEDGDEARLVAILREWENSPETVSGEGPGADLVRTIRKIAQVRLRLDAIQSEMDQLKATDLYVLMARASEAEAQGRDLLASMATALEEEIVVARNELNRISGHGES
jgi:chromosome segregation ATPase